MAEAGAPTDEDESRRHQIDLACPARVIELATRQAEEVLESVANGSTPFDGQRAAQWQTRKPTL